MLLVFPSLFLQVSYCFPTSDPLISLSRSDRPLTPRVACALYCTIPDHPRAVLIPRWATDLAGSACATALITMIGFDQRLLLCQNLSIMVLWVVLRFVEFYWR